MVDNEISADCNLIPLMRALDHLAHMAHDIQRQLGAFDGNRCTEILLVDSSWQYMANTAHSQTHLNIQVPIHSPHT